jgi:hypothetical protein
VLVCLSRDIDVLRVVAPAVGLDRGAADQHEADLVEDQDREERPAVRVEV